MGIISLELNYWIGLTDFADGMIKSRAASIVAINQLSNRWPLDMAGQPPGKADQKSWTKKMIKSKVANWTNWQDGEPNNLGGQVRS